MMTISTDFSSSEGISHREKPQMLKIVNAEYTIQDIKPFGKS